MEYAFYAGVIFSHIDCIKLQPVEVLSIHARGPYMHVAHACHPQGNLTLVSG